MSKTALEETRYEEIKAYIISPNSCTLSDEKKRMFDRIVQASKILDKHPIQRQAVNMHRGKYPEISQRTAYEDLRIALRLFNTLHTFDFDFWRSWLLNDIVKNIEVCRSAENPKDRKIIAMEHANLIKLIGEKPEDLPDPERNEKHQFYILIQNDNRQLKVDLNTLKDLPTSALQELNRAIYGGSEITDTEAEEIMKS
jgi:hypothetical protein